MADFLVEVYTPKLDARTLTTLVARLEAAAEAITREGRRVRFLRSIHVPEDETCFHLFEGESADVVCEAGRRAELLADGRGAWVKGVLERAAVPPVAGAKEEES
jgi:hypothetical protein